MEFIQCEIRQPYSLPVTVAVPNFPRLAELKTRLQQLTAAIGDRQSRLATLTRENALLNQQAEAANPDLQVFDRLATLNREAGQAESELAVARSQAERVEDELKQWTEQFGWNFYRRRLLARELAEVIGAGPQTQMQTTAVGEKRRRTQLEILIELEQVIKWLAAFSGDPDLAQEAAATQRQLEEAYQQQ